MIVYVAYVGAQIVVKDTGTERQQVTAYHSCGIQDIGVFHRRIAAGTENGAGGDENRRGGNRQTEVVLHETDRLLSWFGTEQ